MKFFLKNSNYTSASSVNKNDGSKTKYKYLLVTSHYWKKKLFVSSKHAREKLFNGKIKQKNFDGKTDYSL